MDKQLSDIRKAIGDLGTFVLRKKGVPALHKLNSHSLVQHQGRILPDCPACQELSAKAAKELHNAE